VLTELSDDALRERIAAELAASRQRTHALTVEVLNDSELTAQHSPIMSPLVWDLAHVGNQEELWLVRDVGGREPVRTSGPSSGSSPSRATMASGSTSRRSTARAALIGPSTSMLPSAGAKDTIASASERRYTPSTTSSTPGTARAARNGSSAGASNAGW
jgi:DinB superfamily